MYTPLNLPQAPLQLTRKKETVYVWCIIRKKELVLTPEEWVRQHVIHFLLNERSYPVGLIASEVTIEYNKRKKRADLVLFDRKATPIILVECKAPEVPITEATFHQIAQYNFQMNVDFLMLTNGIQHVVCKIDRKTKQLVYLKEIPHFTEL